METVLVILLLFGVCFLGRFLSRTRPIVMRNAVQPRPPRNPPPPPPLPPRHILIANRVWDYSRSFAYHCGTGVLMGIGVYFGSLNPRMKIFFQSNLTAITILVIMVVAMSKLPIVGDLIKGSTKQIPKPYKAKVVRWCWTNGIAAAIIISYCASSNSHSPF